MGSGLFGLAVFGQRAGAIVWRRRWPHAPAQRCRCAAGLARWRQCTDKCDTNDRHDPAGRARTYGRRPGAAAGRPGGAAGCRGSRRTLRRRLEPKSSARAEGQRLNWIMDQIVVAKLRRAPNEAWPRCGAPLPRRTKPMPRALAPCVCLFSALQSDNPITRLGPPLGVMPITEPGPRQTARTRCGREPALSNWHGRAEMPAAGPVGGPGRAPSRF